MSVGMFPHNTSDTRESLSPMVKLFIGDCPQSPMWFVEPPKYKKRKEKQILEIAHDWCRAFCCILIGQAENKFSFPKGNPSSCYFLEGVHAFQRGCMQPPWKALFRRTSMQPLWNYVQLVWRLLFRGNWTLKRLYWVQNIAWKCMVEQKYTILC